MHPTPTPHNTHTTVPKTHRLPHTHTSHATPPPLAFGYPQQPQNSVVCRLQGILVAIFGIVAGFLLIAGALNTF